MDVDNEQFQAIYSTYQPKLLNYLIHLVGETEAEDLAQEVFIKVGQALPGFRGDSTLSTWLYRIATHAALDSLRSPSFQRMVQTDPTEDKSDGLDNCETGNADKTTSIERQCIKKEMGECIFRYIRGLAEHYQVVLVLSDLEELSNQEIADILGVSLATVKIRLHRARAMLREQLETHCEYYWLSELGWSAS